MIQLKIVLTITLISALFLSVYFTARPRSGRVKQGLDS
jgi:hypothetical protein